MKYKAIIFDFDNTLSRTDKGVSELILWSVNQFLPSESQVEFGYVFEQVKQMVHFDLALEKICGDLQLDLQAVLNMYRSNSRRVKYTCCDGVIDLFKKLELKYPKVIKILVTNRINLLGLRMNDCGFVLSDFDKVLQPADQSEQKPEAVLMHKALDYLQFFEVSADEVVSVGDSVVDYIASLKLGFDFFAVEGGSSQKVDFVEAGLDSRYILKDMSGFMLRLEVN